MAYGTRPAMVGAWVHLHLAGPGGQRHPSQVVLGVSEGGLGDRADCSAAAIGPVVVRIVTPGVGVVRAGVGDGGNQMGIARIGVGKGVAAAGFAGLSETRPVRLLPRT